MDTDNDEKRAPTRARKRNYKTVPREHGFWVMLGLSTVAGLFLASSWLSFSVALAVAPCAIVGAGVFGKKVRRSMVLQVTSAMGLAGLVVPIAVVGNVSYRDAIEVSVPLAVSFLACVLCVQEIILGARKRCKEALWSGRKAMIIAWLSVALAAGLLPWSKTIAIALCAVVVTSIRQISPSPKQLKRVGIGVAIAQLATVVLLLI